MKKEFT